MADGVGLGRAGLGGALAAWLAFTLPSALLLAAFGYGVAGGNGGINCNNPYLSDQQFDFLCGSQGLTEDDIADGVLILRD